MEPSEGPQEREQESNDYAWEANSLGGYLMAPELEAQFRRTKPYLREYFRKLVPPDEAFGVEKGP